MQNTQKLKKKCPQCKKRPVQSHKNSKWCKKCSDALKLRPQSTLSKAEITQAKKLIGKMASRDIAKELNTSISNLKRAFRGVRLAYFNKYVCNPGLVKRVCAYYELNGKKKTQNMFPDICVRSIVERYPQFSPRQLRWTDKQYIELARMAGLVSLDSQARFFNRPRANEGSIKSAWYKKFGYGGSGINGLSNFSAKEIVNVSCPRIRSFYWGTQRNGKSFGRKICLWVDIENHLKPESPEFMKNAVAQMAEFQRWLHGKNAKNNILNMIKAREKSPLIKS